MDEPETSPACSGCGLVIAGGDAGCQRLFDEVRARELSDAAYARVQNLTVDTYCLQHPDRYCRSAKSLAAHLTGLCFGLEYATAHGDIRGSEFSRILSRWLNGTPPLQKPEVPDFRGALTVATVHAAESAESHQAAVERWACSTWDAWSALHPLARRWVEEALATGR